MPEQSARVFTEAPDADRMTLRERIARIWESSLARVSTWLNWLREFFHVAPVAGASIVPSLIAGLLIAFPDQMRESIRILAESWLRIIAFVFFTLISSLTAWYWARVMIYRLMPGAYETDKNSGIRWGVGTFPRLAGTLPVFFAALGVFFARGIGTGPENTTLDHLNWLLMALGVATVVLPLAFLQRRLILDQKSGSSNATVPRSYTVRARIFLAIGLVMGAILVVALAAKPVSVVGWHWMNPAIMVEIATITWIAVFSLIVYSGRMHRWPYVWILIGLSIVFTWRNWNDNHVIRTLPRRATSDLTIGNSFGSWLSQRADGASGTGAYPVVIVAAEGGGIRAAYITAQILATIQDLCPGFAQHVFAISGVSGGSLGAAVFAGLADRFARNDPAPRCDASDSAGSQARAAADTILSRDFLTPVVGMAVYPDLLQRFLFFPVGRFDRARALEDGFTRSWRRQFRSGWGFDSSFYNLRRGDASAVPALFLNTTQVETGDRVAISNLRPDSSLGGRLTMLSGLDSSLDLSMSTAVGLSARFTYVTPEGKIRFASGAKQRYVDGGYFENSGAATATDILYAIRAWQRSPAGQKSRPIRPIILRIGYSEGVDSTRARIDNSGFSDVLSPIFALLNTRGSRGNVVVEELRSAVDQAQAEGKETNMLDLVLTRGRVPLILGWQLSGTARADVRERTRATPCPTDSPTNGGYIHARLREDAWLRAGYCALFHELRGG
ncbi:MAG TPA: hypothetical protein VGN73_08890 [Gemmatimonadaceae bacterium]|nr:hypothetical protein [Gemmatimonadaceae bacterium]